MKKKSLSSVKKKTWNKFSTYIRTRDCVEYIKKHPETNGLMAPCITCNRLYDFKKLQAGHFVSGRTNAVLFDERGVHAQCYGCNVGRSGEAIKYYPVMLERYGQEVVDELINSRNRTVKFTVSELKEMEQEYKQKTELLLKELNEDLANN